MTMHTSPNIEDLPPAMSAAALALIEAVEGLDLLGATITVDTLAGSDHIDVNITTRQKPGPEVITVAVVAEPRCTESTCRRTAELKMCGPLGERCPEHFVEP